MYDALESLKGSMEYKSSAALKLVVELYQLHQHTKPVEWQLCSGLKRSTAVLKVWPSCYSASEIDCQFAAPSADTRAYAASMVTTQEQVSTAASTTASAPSAAATLPVEQTEVLKKLGHKGKHKCREKSKDKSKPTEKRDYSTATCTDCSGTGHYAGKHCPTYKELTESKRQL